MRGDGPGPCRPSGWRGFGGDFRQMPRDEARLKSWRGVGFPIERASGRSLWGRRGVGCSGMHSSRGEPFSGHGAPQLCTKVFVGRTTRPFWDTVTVRVCVPGFWNQWVMEDQDPPVQE